MSHSSVPAQKSDIIPENDSSTGVTGVTGCPICYEDELEIIKSPCNHGACRDCWEKIKRIACHLCNNKNIRDWYSENIKYIPLDETGDNEETEDDEYYLDQISLRENHARYYDIDCRLEDYFSKIFMENGRLFDHGYRLESLPGEIMDMRIETVIDLINEHFSNLDLFSVEVLCSEFPEIIWEIDPNDIIVDPYNFIESSIHHFSEFLRVAKLLGIYPRMFSEITYTLIRTSLNYDDEFATMILEEYLDYFGQFKIVGIIGEEDNHEDIGQKLIIKDLVEQCPMSFLSVMKTYGIFKGTIYEKTDWQQ